MTAQRSIDFYGGLASNVIAYPSPMRVDRLQQAMTDRGHTQSSLARAIGVTQGAVQQIIDGTTKRSKYLPDIAEELGVSFRWLTGDSDEKLPVSRNPSLPIPTEAQLVEILASLVRRYVSAQPDAGKLQSAAGVLRVLLLRYAADPTRFAERGRTELAADLLADQSEHRAAQAR